MYEGLLICIHTPFYTGTHTQIAFLNSLCPFSGYFMRRVYTKRFPHKFPTPTIDIPPKSKKLCVGVYQALLPIPGRITLSRLNKEKPKCHD